jgi:hypothetical protein
LYYRHQKPLKLPFFFPLHDSQFLTPKFITVAIAAFGQFLFFVGLCIGQSALPFANFNPYGVHWFLLFFLILWTLASAGAIKTQAVEEYRLLLVALTSIAISYLPSFIQASLAATIVGTRATGIGNGLMVSGLILIILCMFGFLFMVATNDNSVFNTIPGIPGTNKNKTTEPVIYELPATQA